MGPSSKVLGSWKAWVRVVVGVFLGGLGGNELLVDEPLDGSSSGSSLAKGMPGRDQFGVVVDLVLESPERACSAQRPSQAFTGPVIADSVGEVDHVLIPDVGGNGIDRDEVQVLEVDRVFTVDAGVAGPGASRPDLGLISQRWS